MGRQSINSKLKMADTAEVKRKQTQDQAYAMEKIRANTRLHQKYLAISSQLDDNRTGSIRTHYSIGEIVAELKDQPETYGDDAYNYFKVVFGATVVAKDYRFVKTFSTGDLDRIVSMRSQDGLFSLTYEHIRLILSAKIATKEEMFQYLTRAVNSKWDAKEMWETIKKEQNPAGETRETHGRSHKRPDSKMSLMREIDKVCGQVVKKNTSVWNEEDDPCITMLLENLGDIDEETLSLALQVQGTLTLLDDTVQQLMGYMRRVITGYQNHLGNQTSAEAAESTGTLTTSRTLELLPVEQAAEELFDEVSSNS